MYAVRTKIIQKYFIRESEEVAALTIINKFTIIINIIKNICLRQAFYFMAIFPH